MTGVGIGKQIGLADCRSCRLSDRTGPPGFHRRAALAAPVVTLASRPVGNCRARPTTPPHSARVVLADGCYCIWLQPLDCHSAKWAIHCSRLVCVMDLDPIRAAIPTRQSTSSKMTSLDAYTAHAWICVRHRQTDRSWHTLRDPASFRRSGYEDGDVFRGFHNQHFFAITNKLTSNRSLHQIAIEQATP